MASSNCNGGLEMQGLDNRTQANAAWMEHQILEHVKNALRVTLDWKVPSVGNTS